MTEEHAKLAAEYETLLSKLRQAHNLPDTVNAGTALKLSVASCLHILKRLGPPTAEEAADIGIVEDEA